jgi:hypothetical protein
MKLVWNSGQRRSVDSTRPDTWHGLGQEGLGGQPHLCPARHTSLTRRPCPATLQPTPVLPTAIPSTHAVPRYSLVRAVGADGGVNAERLTRLRHGQVRGDGLQLVLRVLRAGGKEDVDASPVRDARLRAVVAPLDVEVAAARRRRRAGGEVSAACGHGWSCSGPGAASDTATVPEPSRVRASMLSDLAMLARAQLAERRRAERSPACIPHPGPPIRRTSCCPAAPLVLPTHATGFVMAMLASTPCAARAIAARPRENFIVKGEWVGARRLWGGAVCAFWMSVEVGSRRLERVAVRSCVVRGTGVESGGSGGCERRRGARRPAGEEHRAAPRPRTRRCHKRCEPLAKAPLPHPQRPSCF